MEIYELLGNYGAVGILFAWFIYQYFKERSKADTLKNANADRKTDTDEVANKLDNKQEVSLAEMKKDIEFIKLQVSNHIPTTIREINSKLDEHIKNQNEFEKDILVKVARI